MFYVDEYINNLKRVFDQNSRDGYLRLDLNENPEGLPQGFINDVLKGVTPEFVAKYPETNEFQNFLAEKIGVSPDEICLTNGSAEAIRQSLELFSRPGGKVVSVTPAYAMYEVFSKMYGRRFQGVPYKGDFEFDVNDLLDVLTEDVDLLFLMNPNNPVGNAFSREEMDSILDKAEENEINVVIDEAYFYFCPITYQDMALSRSNVILTRTFSKLFSLAGCRLGYCVSRPENIRLIQKFCTPHNVNAFAMRFVTSILSDQDMFKSMIDKQLDGRDHLMKELRSAGYNASDTEGNFVFIETHKDAGMITDELKKKKILVKHYSDPVYSKYIRVSTGGKEVMDTFLKVFFELDS